MFKYKRKKVTKQRGSKTHGWGSMKKHRGAGHRGGRGNAGSGKRGDAKKPTFQKLTRSNYVGRKGFTSVHAPVESVLNIADLEKRLSSLLSKNLCEKKDDLFYIDLTSLGVDKLLGSGKISTKMEVRVAECSKLAKEKIESLGGKVVGNSNPTASAEE